MIRLWRWAIAAPDAGYVQPWNQVISERHQANTERLLLGHAGPVRVVGNRIVERREAQVAARRAREAERRAVVLAWRTQP